MSEYMPEWALGRKTWIITGVFFWFFAQLCWSAVAFSVAGSFDYDLGLFDFSDPASDKGVLVLPHLLLTAGPPLVLFILFLARGWLSTLFDVYRRGRVPPDASGPACGLCGGQGKPGTTYTHGYEDPGLYLCNQCLHSEVRDKNMMIAALLFLTAAACILGGASLLDPHLGRYVGEGIVITSQFLLSLSGTWYGYLLLAVSWLVGAIALIAGIVFLVKPITEQQVRHRGNLNAARGSAYRIQRMKRQRNA